MQNIYKCKYRNIQEYTNIIYIHIQKMSEQHTSTLYNMYKNIQHIYIIDKLQEYNKILHKIPKIFQKLQKIQLQILYFLAFSYIFLYFSSIICICCSIFCFVYYLLYLQNRTSEILPNIPTIPKVLQNYVKTTAY